MFDQGRVGKVNHSSYSYNAAYLGKRSSLALEISPNLTPSICIFKYSPFYVERSRWEVFSPERTLEDHCRVDADVPTELLLVMEYYPYPKAVVEAVTTNILQSNGAHINERLVEHYPDFGYLRVHYLTVDPYAQFNLPKKLNTRNDLLEFFGVNGIGNPNYIGYCTEGIVNKQALKNIDFNLLHAFAKSQQKTTATNLMLMARYLPHQVGYETLSDFYEKYFMLGASRLSLVKPILFANRQYRDVQAERSYDVGGPLGELKAYRQHQQNLQDQWIEVDQRFAGPSRVLASNFSQINAPISDIVSAGYGDKPAAGTKLFPQLATFNAEQADRFITDIHLSQETLFPESISHTIYFKFLKKIKEHDPLQEQIVVANKHTKYNLVPTLDKQFTTFSKQSASLPECVTPGVKAVNASMPTTSQPIAMHALKFVNTAYAYTKAGIGTQQSMALQAPKAQTSGGGALGYMNVFMPAANLVMNFAEMETLGSDPQNIMGWNGVIKGVVNASTTGMGAAALVSAGANKFFSGVGIPILIGLNSFCGIVDGIKGLQDAEQKKEQLTAVLTAIDEALQLATENKFEITEQYGIKISEGLKGLVHEELIKLQKLVAFLRQRYQLDSDIKKVELAVNGSNLAVLLICAALSVVTMGASIAAAKIVTSLSSGALHVATSAMKLSRYADKSLQYNKEYHRVQNILRMPASPRARRLALRDQKLLGWANQLSGKSALQAKMVNPMASVKIVSGATIDDYQRIQLSAFQISTMMRFEDYLSQEEKDKREIEFKKNPAYCYKKIADLFAACIGYNSGLLNPLLLSGTLAGQTLTNFKKAKQHFDASYQQSVIKLAAQIR